MIYKAALIGCGKIASQFAADPKVKGIYTHAAAYVGCPQTELISVCDINESYAVECATHWNVPRYYIDFNRMLLEEKLDIVSICTPDETHLDILEIVLNTSGIKGVLIEKPLGLDEAHAEKLIALAKKNKITLIVNYNRRYAPGHQRVKAFIEDGYLGEIKKISGYYTKGIMHNGTHWLDLARWFIGDIAVMQGFYLNQNQSSDPELDVWLKFKNNAIGYLHNLDANIYSLFEMDILGVNGRIRISNSGYDIEYFSVSESEYFSGYKALKKNVHDNDSISNTLFYVVSDLIDSIENATTPKCSGEDGLAVLHTANELIRSSQIENKIIF